MDFVKKYLDKNYFIKNDNIININSIIGVDNPINIVNDITKIFTLSRDTSKSILIDWLLNNGLDQHQVKYLFPKIEIEFQIDDNDYYLTTDNIEIIKNKSEYVQFGNQRMVAREDGPTINLLLKVNDDDTLIDLFHPRNIQDRNFNMLITYNDNNFSGKMIYNNCYIKELEINMDRVISLSIVSSH